MTYAYLSFLSFLFIALFISNSVDENSSHSFSLSYAQTIPDFSFGVTAGDWGCSTDTQNTVNNIVIKNPPVVLGLGDYSYEPTLDCFYTIIEPIKDKMKIIIGNHDDRSSQLESFNLNFGVPDSQGRQYYSFNYQNIHFIALASEQPFHVGSDQYEFVRNDIQAASADPNIHWIIPVVHRPIVNPVSALAPEPNNLRDIYMPLFEEYGVKLVFTAHIHNYQRSHPVTFNSANPPSPIPSLKTTNVYNDPDGMVVAIVGTGGAFFTGLGTNQDYLKVRHQSFGFINVDVTNDGKTLNVAFLANDGTIKDQFSITQTSKPTPSDTIPPLVLSTEPLDESTSTTSDSDISATFNEPILGSTANTANFLLTDNTVSSPVAGTVSLDSDGGRIIFTPSSQIGLIPGHTYTAKLTTGIKDLAGNPLSSEHQWTFTVEPPKYHYEPFLTLSGSNFTQVPSNPSLQLSTFSVSAWFKTGSQFESDSYIVNKGGTGSESAGRNMNYGIWMTSSEKIRAGFETSSGTDAFVTTSNTYNDDKWHYATATFDGAVVRLYIDGIPVGALTTSLLPDNTGTQPIRVGANSLNTNGFFVGNVDEVRVYNRALTPTEVTEAYNDGIFNTNGQLVYLPFNVEQPKYHYEPFLTLSGSNFTDVPSNPSLQLSTFSVSAWFKTGSQFASNSYIVNKGGTGSDSAGRNMNYGIWMTSSEKIRAGFETSSGPDVFVTSADSYNDDQWHYATATYDGTDLRLYIDGSLVSTLTTSLLPDNTGTQPIRVGANSLTLNGFFVGNVDEVRVYNRALTPTEVTEAYNDGIFNTNGQLVYLPF